MVVVGDELKQPNPKSWDLDKFGEKLSSAPGADRELPVSPATEVLQLMLHSSLQQQILFSGAFQQGYPTSWFPHRLRLPALLHWMISSSTTESKSEGKILHRDHHSTMTMPLRLQSATPPRCTFTFSAFFKKFF